MPGRFSGRGVDDGEHVGSIDGQAVLTERAGELPGALERTDRGRRITARSTQAPALQQAADPDAIIGRMLGVDAIQLGVPVWEATLEAQRSRQLGARLGSPIGVSGSVELHESGSESSLGTRPGHRSPRGHRALTWAAS